MHGIYQKSTQPGPMFPKVPATSIGGDFDWRGQSKSHILVGFQTATDGSSVEIANFSGFSVTALPFAIDKIYVTSCRMAAVTNILAAAAAAFERKPLSRRVDS